jgi:predicted transglutaminase-like cysteine proteinase
MTAMAKPQYAEALESASIVCAQNSEKPHPAGGLYRRLLYIVRNRQPHRYGERTSDPVHACSHIDICGGHGEKLIASAGALRERASLRRLFFGIIFSASALALSGCASTAIPPASSMMQVGAAVPSPIGYLDFCQRHVDQCGAEAREINSQSQTRTASILADRRYYWQTAFDQSVPNSVSRGNVEAPQKFQRFDWQLAFASADASQRIAARASSDAGDLNYATTAHNVSLNEAEMRVTPPVLTSQLWQSLQTVNNSVNSRVRERSDLVNYGVADYWELPLEGGNGAGDCEDFALEKRKQLMDQGVPENALSIALVKTSWGESHSVLLVRTDKGDYVLDNLSSWIDGWKDVDYTWVERQSNIDPDLWVKVGSN